MALSLVAQPIASRPPQLALVANFVPRRLRAGLVPFNQNVKLDVR